jgi:diguanylate cyclase (GGDEF)-like protein
MRASAWRIYLAIEVAAIGGCFLLPGTWWGAALYTGAGLGGAGGVAAGIILNRPRHPAPWWLLAFGLMLEAVGDFLYACHGLVLDDPDRFPSLADGAYLLGCLPLAAAMILMARARTPGRDRAGVIDATIVASGVGLLSWVFLMAPTAGSTDLTWTGQLVALAYPIWDVLLLALVVRLAGVAARTPALWLLVVAAGLWLVADSGYAALVRYSGYNQDDVVNAFWLAGFLLFGFAALHPSMVELTEPTAEPAWRLSRQRLALLTGVSLIAPSMLLAQTIFRRGQVDGIAIAVSSAVLFLLVVLRMAGLVRQVEDQAGQLAVLARRDGLTGVPNRRAWDDELPVAVDRARRDGVPLSVALLDLDHFKRFNDEYGHQAGDRLLKSATAAWGGMLRSVDLLCRYGGEEFGLLLPNATGEQAAEVVERLSAVTPLGQSFSAGIACWDGQEFSDDVVHRADRALYAAKAAGRNRVLIAESTPERLPDEAQQG